MIEAPKGQRNEDRNAQIIGFEQGKYPYKNKIARRAYEVEKAVLQVELLKVQHWIQETGQKCVLLFEGRDAAGKGGTIKRFTEHLNPRAARVVALNRPTDEERGSDFFNAIPSTCRHQEKWCYMTAHGTIARASSG